MAEPRVEAAERSLVALRTAAWLLLGLSVLVVMVAVLLPNTALAWLRSEYWLFGAPLNWLEMSSPRVDVTHVILFAWVAFLVSCLWPRVAWWRVALPLLGLAIATELLQIFVPGRSPLASDLHDDLLGVLIGLLLALPVRFWARRRAT